MLRRDFNTWTEAIVKVNDKKATKTHMRAHETKTFAERYEKMGTVLGADPTKGT